MTKYICCLACVHEKGERDGNLKPTNSTSERFAKRMSVLFASSSWCWKLSDVGFIPEDTTAVVSPADHNLNRTERKGGGGILVNTGAFEID